jgi:hypothetical protein
VSAVDNYLIDILGARPREFLLPYNLVCGDPRFKTENYLPLSEYLAGEQLSPSEFLQLVHKIIANAIAATDSLIFCFSLDREKIYISEKMDLRFVLEPTPPAVNAAFPSLALWTGSGGEGVSALIGEILTSAANPELRIPAKKILHRIGRENPSLRNMLKIVEEVMAEWHIINP